MSAPEDSHDNAARPVPTGDPLSSEVASLTSGEADFDPGEGYVIDPSRTRHGSMGAVYKARSTYLKHPSGEPVCYAVKRVLVPTATLRRRFLCELVTWLALPEHPHLVHGKYFRLQGDEILIFADWIEGGSLADAIARGKASKLETILDVAIQMAWGLHAMHEQEVIHQDVKPDNVVLTPHGRVLMTDFGLSGGEAREVDSRSSAKAEAHADPDFRPTIHDAQVDRGNRPGLSLLTTYAPGRSGSGPYQSPEQAKGERVTHRTDMYSWAATVVEMFYGHLCWTKGSHVPARLAAFGPGANHDNEALDIPAALKVLLADCLAPDASARPADMSQIAMQVLALRQRLLNQTKDDYPWPTPHPGLGQSKTESLKQIRAGFHWPDPAEFLDVIATVSGEKPNDLRTDLPPRKGSRRAVALADLAWYVELTGLVNAHIQGNARASVDVQSSLTRLWLCEAQVLGQLNDYAGQVSIVGLGIALCERLISEGKPDLEPRLANLYGTCGLALYALDSFEGEDGALALNMRAIEIFERLVAGGRSYLEHDLASAWMNRGLALSSLGHFEGANGALAAYARAIDIYESLVAGGRGDREHHLARAWVSRGVALVSLGSYEGGGGALAAHARAIDILQRLVAGGRSDLEDDLAVAWMNQGNALDSLGQYEGEDGALAATARAIDILERLVAGGRSDLEDDLAVAWMNQGNALNSLGQYEGEDGALAATARAIKIFERLVAGGRSDLEKDLAGAWGNQGNALNSLGRFEGGDGALAAHVRAIEVFERLVASGRGGLEDTLARAWMNRGNALKSIGRYEGAVGALAAYVRAIAILERLVADGRRDLEDELARVWMNQGVALRFLDRLEGEDGSMAAYARAIAILERLVADGRRDLEDELARVWMNQGVALDSLGRYEGADGSLAAYVRAVDILERLVAAGRRDLEDDLASAWMNRAVPLRFLGRLEGEDGSMAAYARAIAIIERLVAGGRGGLEDDLARAWMNRGNDLNSLGRYEGADGALAAYVRATDMLGRLVAGGRSDLEDELARVWMNQGVALDSLGRYEGAVGALVAYARAIAMLERLVAGGRSDLENDLSTAYHNRAYALYSMRRLEDAAVDAHRAVGILERLIQVHERQDLLTPFATSRSLLEEIMKTIEQRDNSQVTDPPMAVPSADPDSEGQRNIRYQNALAEWKALPFLKRWQTPEPQLPAPS